MRRLRSQRWGDDADFWHTREAVVNLDVIRWRTQSRLQGALPYSHPMMIPPGKGGETMLNMQMLEGQIPRTYPPPRAPSTPCRERSSAARGYASQQGVGSVISRQH